MKRLDLLEQFYEIGKKPKNYPNGYSDKTIKTLVTEFKRIEKEIMTTNPTLDGIHVHFSTGNSKIGEEPSVSLRTILDCGNCSKCKKVCYDLKDTIRNQYSRLNRVENYLIYKYQPERYFKEISNYVMLNYLDFFRWHIGGDIIDKQYYEGIKKVARDNPQCNFLVYTKMYDLINEDYEEIENLKIMFSVYEGIECSNQHNLPTFHIIDKEGNTTAEIEKPLLCGGNCVLCRRKKIGCNYAQIGECTVVALH